MNPTRDIIKNLDREDLRDYLKKFHIADITEAVEQLKDDKIKIIFDNLNLNQKAELLGELEEDIIEDVSTWIPDIDFINIFKQINSDDTRYIIKALDKNRQKHLTKILSQDKEFEDIIELLGYEEDTAGSLMEKESIVVYEEWTAFKCLREIRKQTDTTKKINNIYVLNDNHELVGILPVKNLITTSTRTPVSEITVTNIVTVKASESASRVAYLMKKYDLFVLPVVNDNNELIGKITVDDVIDYITDEAEREYQLASGITEEVEIDDSVFKLTRARIPWLIIGILGGLASARVMGSYEIFITELPILAFFIPLITATGGNIGVQSSAIMVRALSHKAEDSMFIGKIFKEIKIGLINSLILGICLAISMYIMDYRIELISAVSTALFCIVVIASTTGTLIPFILESIKIDPAVATGPFITTMNDIFGIVMYFYLCSLLL